MCGDLEPIPSSTGRFYVVIIYIFGCLDGREISPQEENLLVCQLCSGISSLLGNCAASALFPHERAMSEVAAFNFCSKFDGSRKKSASSETQLFKNLIIG